MSAEVEHATTVGLLAVEQAALRRVATLVAEGVAASDLFSAVAQEVALLLDVPVVSLGRYEPDATSTVLAALNDPGLSVGSRLPLDGPSVMTTVRQTGRPVRIDDYSALPGTVAAASRVSALTSAVGVPIVVDGDVWGIIGVGTTAPGPLPPDTEERLAGFTELVATAIANSQARDDLRRLAEEQAALRRVATLVAEGASADELFAAVGEEVAGVLDVPMVMLDRYESDGCSTVLAVRGAPGFVVGGRWSLEGDSLAARVYASERPARIDDYSDLPGPIAARIRSTPVVSTVGVPIAVEGKVWGVICVGTTDDQLLPPDTEDRLANFTELVATAVSNATTRAELIASRARIVAAGDEARRKVERNLHDGAQQRLLALGLDLRAVRTTLADAQPELRAELERIERDLEVVLFDIRELSQGLHPSLLARAGLGPSLKAVARRSPIPVDLCLDVDRRPPQAVEIAVYYVVSEALTNAAKHSRATEVSVTVTTAHDCLRATIQDDGVGGAEPGKGSGLVGLTDRVEALGGRLTLAAPPGQGTRITVELPLNGGRT
jgi:signal transduction histidine kinase